MLSSVPPEADVVTIVDQVRISKNVPFLTHNETTWLLWGDRGQRFQMVKIGIGNDVIVGAGNFGMRYIPPDSIGAQNPALPSVNYAGLETCTRKSLKARADIGGMRTMFLPDVKAAQ